MTPTLAIADGLVIALYLAVLFFVGLRAIPAAQSADNRNRQYLLAGRRLTLVPFVATLVSTWYGGILGVGEFTYAYGVVNLLVFGLPYYLFALLYALYLAPKIRSSDDLSIPERLNRYYGPLSARFGALIVFALATPAPYLLMLAILAKWMFGISLWQGLILGALVSTAYLWRTGFAGVVRTDILQIVLMLTGFGLLLAFLISDTPPGAMWAELPGDHRSITAGGAMSWQVIFVWFLIASWTFVDPGFYQRCAAAGSPAIARKGILTSIGIWFVFDLMTTAAGLYAAVKLPGLSTGVEAYPALGIAILPPGLRGLFMVALMAVIMSTIDSFTFISGITAGRDLGAGITWRMAEGTRIRWGMAIALALGIAMAWGLPSVVGLWFTIGSLLVPGLLVPLVLTFTPFKPLPDLMVLLIGVAGVATSGLWHIIPLWLKPPLPGADIVYPLGLQPMLPGLAITMLLGLWGIILGSTKRGG